MDVQELPHVPQDILEHIGRFGDFNREDQLNIRNAGLEVIVRNQWRPDAIMKLFHPDLNEWPTPAQWIERVGVSAYRLRRMPVQEFKVVGFNFSFKDLLSEHHPFRWELWLKLAQYIHKLHFENCEFTNYALLDLLDRYVLPNLREVSFNGCTLKKSGKYKSQKLIQFQRFEPPVSLSKLTVNGRVPCPSGEKILIMKARNSIKDLTFIDEGYPAVFHQHRITRLWVSGWRKTICCEPSCSVIIGTDSEHDVTHPGPHGRPMLLGRMPTETLDHLNLKRCSSLVLNDHTIRALSMIPLRLDSLKFNVSKYMNMQQVGRFAQVNSQFLEELEIFRSPDQLPCIKNGTFKLSQIFHFLDKFTAVGTVINDLEFLRKMNELKSLEIRTDCFKEFEKGYQFARNLQTNYIYQTEWTSLFPINLRFERFQVMLSLRRFYLDVPQPPIVDLIKLLQFMPNISDLSLRMNDQILTSVVVYCANLLHLTALYGSRLTDAGLLNVNVDTTSELESFTYNGLCGDSRLSLECVGRGLLMSPNLNNVYISVGPRFPLHEGRLQIKQRLGRTVTYVTVTHCSGNDEGKDECCRRRAYLRQHMSPTDWNKYYNPENPIRG